jgi:ribosome-associated protein
LLFFKKHDSHPATLFHWKTPSLLLMLRFLLEKITRNGFKMSKNELQGEELVALVAKILFEKRAEEVKLINLEGLSDVCDRFIIGTCGSEAQMKAVITALARGLKTAGVRPIGTDHSSGSRWAVMDMGDLMIHLFEAEHRKFYSLERLWADATISELHAEDYISDDLDDEEENEYL